MFWFFFSAKCLADLVNESLSLNEEDAIAASSATESHFQRLSSPPKDAAAAAFAATPTPMTSSSELPSASSQPVKRSRVPGPPADKLIGITSSMNQHLTSLLVRPLGIFS